ncbi:MAG: hypothetical protein JNM63_05645, partial [Spirochaetia bacterium]|nr:hypothetical protein [Spirochaetia bacterium]
DAHRNSWYTALYRDKKRVSDYLDLEEGKVKLLLEDPSDFFSGMKVGIPVNAALKVCGEWRMEWRTTLSMDRLEWISGERTKRVDETILEALEGDVSRGKVPVDLVNAVPFYLRRSEAENLLAENKKKSPP